MKYIALKISISCALQKLQKKSPEFSDKCTKPATANQTAINCDAN